MAKELKEQEESQEIASEATQDEASKEANPSTVADPKDDSTKDHKDSSIQINKEEDSIEEELEEDLEEEKSGRSFFKRNKKDKKDEKIEELNDRLMRSRAEFDNFRKRSEKEKSTMYEIGAKHVVETILPVIDSFERGFDAVTKKTPEVTATAEGTAAAVEEIATAEDPFVIGMKKVYKQLMSNLEEIGVKPIESVGKEFNPDIHNAVMHEEDSEQGENIIIEEFQKGYMYKDNVVRYSMVKVVN